MQKTFIFSILNLVVLTVFTNAFTGADETVRKENSSEAVAKLKAGDLLEFELKEVKWRFHWCPAGRFTMGSPSSDINSFDNETQHKVTLTQGFWMEETEVTQGQWESVLEDNPSHFKGGNLPVETVSWDDCQGFVRKLNELLAASRVDSVASGYHFSLPTEAQWEYACRAGSTTAYCFGDDVHSLSDYAWYNTSTSITTHPVGTKKANAWGLYDVHGNVWEWCQDWYGDYSADAVVDPINASGLYRVFRGSRWVPVAQFCRSATRFNGGPKHRHKHLGLRVCLVPSK